MTLTLASGSPRRKELLSRAGWTLDICPPDVDETRLQGEDPVAMAKRLAMTKGLTIEAPVVVAADTIVHMADSVMGKPIDRDHAASELRRLSGGWHGVTTGVMVRGPKGVVGFHQTTQVRFRRLTEDEIWAYVSTGEADDKAGSYGLQGLGGQFVAELHGSWTNVMGLPLEATLQTLARLGAVR